MMAAGDSVVLETALACGKGDEDCKVTSGNTATSSIDSCDGGCSSAWTIIIHNRMHRPILKGMHVITSTSASYPRRTIGLVVFISVLLFVSGYLTRFDLRADGADDWTPFNSLPAKHAKWIDQESGFSEVARPFFFLLHGQGENILGRDAIQRSFEALDAIRNVEGYDAFCQPSFDHNGLNKPACDITSVTAFWNHSVDIFNDQVKSDDDVIQALSALNYPDGTPVSKAFTMGYSKKVEKSSALYYSVLSFITRIDFPTSNANVERMEGKALNAIFDVVDVWRAQTGSSFRLEVSAERSAADEFDRALVDDIPLVPIVFVMMTLFTSLVFWKQDKVQSRSLLGLSAVLSVFLSIMVGFGLVFWTGTPFTSITPLLPFVILGIGLDDSFIMSGAYDRTDPSKGPKERIYDTVQDVGISITVSTITTTLAFGLGCISTIPTIYWLCLYAFPTVMCVYIYQLTFFVACIVLDERRIQQHRHDCCTWINVDDDGEDDDDEQEEQTEDTSTTISGITEKYILLYADILLRPRVKTIVVLLFTGLAAACIFSVSLLSQEMDLTKILPSDSYLTAYMDAVDVYSEMGMRRPPYAYFRFVDQSNETVQMHMENYVNDFVSIAAVSSQPGRFWLRDFKGFVNTSDAEEFGQLDFNSKVDAFLSDPVFGELYRRDIVRDKYLTITASRCLINMNNVDILDVHDQVKAFEDQQRVAAMSPVNQGREDLAFFSYSEMYEPWVFYTVAVDELILTTVIGVVAVTGVSFLFVPHWTAALFVLPLICILYVDLLGVLQWAGVHINAVSYLSMVMSIGLLVDYVIHILFRYYESAGNRKEKTVEMLRTMGSSILMGGISTFLGTLPLAFCTSDIFSTVFFGFMGLVTLGCGHGLILMPVILSTIGPEDHHVVLEVKPESDRVQSDLKREIERTKIMEIDDPPVFLASSLPVSL